MSSTTKLRGVTSRGGDVPPADPNEMKIIGYDEPDSDAYWWAYCSRAAGPVDDAMVAAFRESNIVLDPIKVRRDGDGCVLLDGRRRTKAARVVWNEQKAAHVPVKNRINLRFIVVPGSDDDAAKANRDGNEGRLDYTPIQKALQLAHFSKFLRGTQEEQAAKLGCTAGTVRNLTAILECAPKVQKAIEDGVIAYSHAPTFAKLDRAEQSKRLEKMVAAGATKGARAKQAAKTGDTAPVTKMKSRAFLERLAVELPMVDTRYDDVHHVLQFILGKDAALEHLPADVKEAIARAGTKKESAAK